MPTEAFGLIPSRTRAAAASVDLPAPTFAVDPAPAPASRYRRVTHRRRADRQQGRASAVRGAGGGLDWTPGDGGPGPPGDNGAAAVPEAFTMRDGKTRLRTESPKGWKRPAWAGACRAWSASLAPAQVGPIIHCGGHVRRPGSVVLPRLGSPGPPVRRGCELRCRCAPLAPAAQAWVPVVTRTLSAQRGPT